MTSWVRLDESCLSVDQDNIVEAKRKFEEIRLNRMKRDLTKTTVPSYYSPDMLVCKDAAEEQIELLEQFVLTNDAHSKRRILFQLVPATMDEYVDAFLNGKPYPTDPIIDKLMDTEDWKTRKKLVENAGININDVILRDIPYMPLHSDERKEVFLHGAYMEHKHSPYRRDAYSKPWNELTEKEKTVIKVMDADHRLSFDAANLILNAYEKKLTENEQENRASAGEQTSIDEGHDFWLSCGSDSHYMKRRGYAALKLADKKITDEAIRQAGASCLLNYINMEINPILLPLVAWASAFHYKNMDARVEEVQPFE